jgi:isoleucyl-tRNA synthetase
MAAALREHGTLVADEVLAIEVAETDPADDWVRFDDLGLALTLSKAG